VTAAVRLTRTDQVLVGVTPGTTGHDNCQTPEGYRGEAWPLLVVICLAPECVGMHVQYGDAIGQLYQELQQRGWRRYKKRPARCGWRCPAHTTYQPSGDDWADNPFQWGTAPRFRGRVRRCGVIFCGEPGCTALRLGSNSGPWLAIQQGRQEGWSKTRFGWRCPPHAKWWLRAQAEQHS